LEVHDHPCPYPLGKINKDANLKITKQCKIGFSINDNFIDEVELDVVPLDVCRVMFGSPDMYMWEIIFMQRANQYWIVKDGKLFTINKHKGT